MIKKASAKKSNKKLWISLIMLPFAGFVIAGLVQVAMQVFTATHTIVVIANIITVLVGMASAICLILLPVWVIMLIKEDKSAKGKL